MESPNFNPITYNNMTIPPPNPDIPISHFDYNKNELKLTSRPKPKKQVLVDTQVDFLANKIDISHEKHVPSYKATTLSWNGKIDLLANILGVKEENVGDKAKYSWDKELRKPRPRSATSISRYGSKLNLKFIYLFSFFHVIFF